MTTGKAFVLSIGSLIASEAFSYVAIYLLKYPIISCYFVLSVVAMVVALILFVAFVVLMIYSLTAKDR